MNKKITKIIGIVIGCIMIMSLVACTSIEEASAESENKNIILLFTDNEKGIHVYKDNMNNKLIYIHFDIKGNTISVVDAD